MGLPRWPFTTGTTTWPEGRFLNAPINSVKSPAPIKGWSASAMMTASKGPLSAVKPDAHGALLPRHVCLVVSERHHVASYLFLDRMPGVAGDYDHFVDAGTTQGDQMPADQRHAL